MRITHISNVTEYTALSFRQYYTLLTQHDWFHDYSDSLDVRREGEDNEDMLNAIGGRHDFSCYMFSMFCEERNEIIRKTFTERLTIEEMKSAWNNIEDK